MTLSEDLKNNVVFLRLLGLCPLLAISTNAVDALGLALATGLVLLLSSSWISLSRKFIPKQIRIPVFMTVIATLVTLLDLLMSAYFYELTQRLGIFLPLIVSNCVILSHAEQIAYKEPLKQSTTMALRTGLTFAGVLFLMGSIREIIGAGTWMADAKLLLGDMGTAITLELWKDQGVRLIQSPPGAFFTLAFLAAVYQFVTGRRSKTAVQAAHEQH